MLVQKVFFCHAALISEFRVRSTVRTSPQMH